MNALRKLSTGERVTIALAALVIAAAVTEIITGAGLRARVVTFGVLALIIGCHFTLRLIGTGGGAHAAPRGWNADLRPLPVAARVIPRSAVSSAPPWEDAPLPEGCELELSPVLVRAALLLPSWFDPEVDSMVDGPRPRQDDAGAGTK